MHHRNWLWFVIICGMFSSAEFSWSGLPPCWAALSGRNWWIILPQWWFTCHAFSSSIYHLGQDFSTLRAEQDPLHPLCICDPLWKMYRWKDTLAAFHGCRESAGLTFVEGSWLGQRCQDHAQLPRLGTRVFCHRCGTLQSQTWPGEYRSHTLRKAAYTSSTRWSELFPTHSNLCGNTFGPCPSTDAGGWLPHGSEAQRGCSWTAWDVSSLPRSQRFLRHQRPLHGSHEPRSSKAWFAGLVPWEALCRNQRQWQARQLVRRQAMFAVYVVITYYCIYYLQAIVFACICKALEEEC